MSKSIVRRIKKIEKQTATPRWKVVVRDCTTDAFYRGDCGDGLTQEQFSKWANSQDLHTQIIVIELSCTLDALKVVVENHADKNTEDLLREYHEIIAQQVNEEVNRRADAIIKFSSEENKETEQTQEP